MAGAYPEIFGFTKRPKSGHRLDKSRKASAKPVFTAGLSPDIDHNENTKVSSKSAFTAGLSPVNGFKHIRPFGREARIYRPPKSDQCFRGKQKAVNEIRIYSPPKSGQ
jgi:hypothetical protein